MSDVLFTVHEAFAWSIDHSGGWVGIVALCAVCLIATSAISFIRERIRLRRKRAIWPS